VKLGGPDLVSRDDLTAVVLPPELENFLPPLGRFSEVSKASTFASSMSSIPLDIAYVLGILSLLSLFTLKPKRFHDLCTPCRVPTHIYVICPELYLPEPLGDFPFFVLKGKYGFLLMTFCSKSPLLA
jgi:hypothetical protein